MRFSTYNISRGNHFLPCVDFHLSRCPVLSPKKLILLQLNPFIETFTKKRDKAGQWDKVGTN